MWKILPIFIITILLLNCGFCVNSDIKVQEQEGRILIEELNKKTAELLTKLITSVWNQGTNLTTENLQKRVVAITEFSNHERLSWEKVWQYDWQKFSDENLKRQFRKYSILGGGALSDEKQTKLTNIFGEMQTVYSTAKVCDYTNKTKCDLSLNPEIASIFKKSQDPEELKHIWSEWSKAIGPKVRDLYIEHVSLKNEEATLNNLTDGGEFMLMNYEDPTIKAEIETLWLQLEPLYLKIHSYVRFQLRKKYGEIVPEKGPIPVHLLGSLWAHTWRPLADHFQPFPSKKAEDLTEALKKQNYTVTKIFKTAEDFFKSINFTALPEEFWKTSILEKIKDRNMTCHPESVDFRDGKTFAIKMCTKIAFDQFITAHHEMGHVEYYLQYKAQPILFREGANPGFHEAIGDLISLSVQSHKHLRKLGLLHSETDPETLLNNLFQISLDKIVFLPFSYLLDLWRWDVFSGKVTPEEYNCRWWELREKYQGVSPPLNRTREDLDPASIFHVVIGAPYIEYFISYVIQFQFHKTLCVIAGEYDPNDPSKPLHECDIYQNVKAGNALKKMLEMGGSRPWPDAMEVLTGQRTMDASGLLEYFKPLSTWLDQEIQKNNLFVGWEKPKDGTFKYC